MSYQAGDISLIELLKNEIAALYMSEQCSDITLNIEGQNIPAHRSIIGARCEYLKIYFSNGLNEPNQNKFKLDVPLKALQVLLKYFYTGQMTLSKIENLETLIQILNLVEEYCLFYLKTHFENYLKEIITVENACRLLEVAKTYELKELETKSLNLIDTNADLILASESFKKIHKDLLEEILTRDTFIASSELFIFRAIADWSKHANQNMDTVIHLVKLPLIPLEELLQIGKSGTFPGEKIFDAIEKQMTTKSIPRSDSQRFAQLPEQNENVVSSKYNARTLQGGVQDNHGITFRYQHVIGDGSSIIVELGQIFIINNLIVQMWGNYAYYIEISTDQKKWERIIDYSSFDCRSMQNLYFPPKPVKYVKIVGTSFRNSLYCMDATSSTFFNVATFEAYYRENIPEIRNGIVVPKEKVEHIVCWSSDGWVMRMDQPYYIDSIRFLIIGTIFSSCKPKFYLETSLNIEDWEEVADKRDEIVNGWQTFRFNSKPIMYIRINPISCDPYNPYKCEHTLDNLECPSSV